MANNTARICFLSIRKYALPIFCTIIFVLGCLLHYQRGYFTNSPNYFNTIGADDAYISYRYGWNLVHYGIPSWNESGFRQTEGFTNPLWMLISAAWAFGNDKDIVYPGMAITSVATTSVLLFYLACRIRDNSATDFALGGVFLLSVSPILWLHTTSGLESALFGALIGLTGYIAIFDTAHHMKYLGLFVFISVLLRSDGFTYILILLCGLLITKAPAWKHVALGLTLGVIILFTWRLLAFGLLLPNTAIAKLNFSWMERILTGLQYLLISLPGMLPLIMFGLLAMRRLSRKQQIAFGLTFAGWVAYYAYIGGDIYLERHILGSMFLLGSVTSFQFDHMQVNWKQAITHLTLLTVFMFLPIMIGDSRFEYWKQKPMDPWILFGKEIGKDRNQYGVIVISAAGKIPFYAGGDFVDELGLNDPYLSTLKRADFIPGHCAGSRDVATKIAYSKNNNSTYFAFGKELSLENKNRVLLWINNIDPETGVHHSLSRDDTLKIMSSHPLGHTVLLQSVEP